MTKFKMGDVVSVNGYEKCGLGEVVFIYEEKTEKDYPFMVTFYMEDCDYNGCFNESQLIKQEGCHFGNK